MNKKRIRDAIATNKPFTLLMADGKEYEIKHQDYIHTPPKGAYVMVFDDEEHFYALPLITMTGLKQEAA